jgi:hypothetical protein
MRCKIGDMAVVIDAYHRCNLGNIVRVIEPHDGTGDLIFGSSDGHVWLVEAARPMTWTVKKKRYRRKVGPAPDNQLQPIRDSESDIQISAAVKKLIRKLKSDVATTDAKEFIHAHE